MASNAAAARGDVADTRAAVIEAAIDTILEQGYYRASSNEIARRAGVTWGVIQHHFGTRENLVLAALEHVVAAQTSYLAAATVQGDTLVARLESYGAILWDYYATEPFLAHLQIIVNLGHDPTTAQGTIDAMDSALRRNVAAMTRLLADAVAPMKLRPDDRELVFALLRGVALDHLVLATLHPSMVSATRRQRLLRAASEAVAEYLSRRRR